MCFNLGFVLTVKRLFMICMLEYFLLLNNSVFIDDCQMTSNMKVYILWYTLCGIFTGSTMVEY